VPKRLRIFFATDIHGSDVCFRKFVNAADFYGAKVLILGGDITGKTITPIIQTPEGGWRVKFLGEVIEVRNPKRLKEVVGRIGEVGSYPLVLTAKEYEDFQNDPAGVTAVFDRLMHDSVVRWVRLAEERLRGKDVEIFVQPGNDDTYAIDDALRGSDVVVTRTSGGLDQAPGARHLQCPRATLRDGPRPGPSS